MNKKRALFALSSVGTLACVGLVIAIANSSDTFLRLRAGTGVVKTHTITFDSVSLDQYDDNEGGYGFSLASTVTDSDGKDWDITSVSGTDTTYLFTYGETYYDEDAQEDKPVVEVNTTAREKDCLFYFPHNENYYFYLTFDIVNKAEVDLNESGVYYTVVSKIEDEGEIYYQEENKMFEFNSYEGEEGVKEGHTRYSIYDGFYHDEYECEILITEIKLVFDCVQ